MTRPARPARIAILIDLTRGADAGGHVKYWERVAKAAARDGTPVDLTLYFSGPKKEEILAPNVRYRYLPPILSTSKLKFLPYIPAHTDLAPFHPALARELVDYDLLHTTDAYFAFARTAERIAMWNNLPLVTSFHTDTPAYTELFTRQTLRSLFGPNLAGWINGRLRISVKERLKKEKRLAKHVKAADAVMAMRAEDRLHAPGKTFAMRLGVDKEVFAPDATARAEIEKEFNIPPGQFIVLFVGRIDAGKNLPTLLRASAKLRAQGVPMHLLLAGAGPMENEVKKTLGGHASLAGFVAAEKLAKFYNAADCLAIASDIEIGGMIGLEALACGCPVLVSKLSEIANLFGHPTGMQEVESGVDHWVAALAEFAGNKNRQRHMRDAALKFREEHLASWDQVWKEDFLPVWQKTLACAPARNAAPAPLLPGVAPKPVEE